MDRAFVLINGNTVRPPGDLLDPGEHLWRQAVRIYPGAALCQQLEKGKHSIGFMGKTGASATGDTGLPFGPSGGCMGVGKSAARLYHWRGISSSL